MFKLKKWLALLAIGVIGGVAFGNSNEYKAQATSKTDNTVVVNNDTTVSSKYSFIFRWIDGKTTAQTFNFGQGSFDSIKADPNSYNGYGGTHYMYHLKSRNDLGKFGIIYHNVGTYRGKTIDLKITITDYDPRNPSGGIQFSEGIISLDTQDMAFVKQRWDFYDAKTNEKVKINGYVTINDIDWTQGVTFDSETSKHIQNVLVTKDTIVDVTKSNGEIAVQDSGLHKDIDPMTKRGWATVLFNDADNLTFKWCVHDLDSKPYQCHEPEKVKWEGRWDGDYFGYTEKKLARTEIITPEKYIQSNGNKVTEKTITSDDGVEYSLLHKVPDEISDFYYGSYELKDEVPDCLKIKSYGIYNETGQNVSNLFDDKTSGNSIRYVAKKNSLEKNFFYGHDYYVKIKADVYKPNVSKYKINHDVQIKNNFTVTIDGKTKRSNDTILKIKHQSPPSPVKTASISQVSFDGKEFTYDVKQQMNRFNTDIFDKYSQMSFDDKVPDSLQVTDVQILKDGTDVTEQVGSVYGRNGRGFYNNERNHVHCDFSSGYLDKMSLDGETYTMRIHVKYTAHKLQSQETEIKNSAEVRINNDGRTASATVKVPENQTVNDPIFKKISNKSTFDGTKDETVRYTLITKYSNKWHPWGSSFKDNMPDNATLDTNSIKVTYYDPMIGEHQNLNVNDYFTNKSDSKHLELVMNKGGSTDKFINSQVTVTYNMTIHGNSYWSGGYSDKPGTKYYNAGTGKITVPNIATWKEGQDDNAPVLKAEADMTTDARPSSLQKSAAQSTFDYSKEQTLSYTLSATFGNLTYPKGAVLRDAMPENCTLDTNSIRMKLTDPAGKTSDVKASDYFTDKSDSKHIELIMNKNMQESSMRMFINSKLTVTYNMKISGNADWSDYYNSTAHRIDVPNTATFTDSESPDKTTHSSTATITTQCQEPSITAYIAQDNGNFMQGTKKVHYSRNSTDLSEKAVTTAYKVVVGNYRKVSVLSVLAASPEGFDISRVVTRNSISNNAEAKSQDYTGTGLALSVSGNSARAEKTNAQSLVGKSFTMIVKTAPTVRNWQKYAKLAGNTGSYRAGLSLTYRSSGGADGKNIYANTVSATVPNVYEYKPLASVKTADGKLKYYGKLSGLAVSASNPTTFTSNAVTLNGSSVALPGGIKTSQSQNIVTSLNAANKAEIKANNDLENADRAVIVTDSKLNAGESDTGIKTDFTPMNNGKITKANTLYLNSYGQINYYDYDNGKISRKVLNEAYVFSAKFDEPQAKGGYGIYNPNSLKAVCYNDFADIADKFATVFTDRDGLTDAGYIAKHGSIYTEKLDFTSKTGNADISNIDTVLGKTTLNAADRNRNLKQTVLGTTGADETDHALKQARENELHLTPQAHYLNLNYRFNHRGLTNGKQFLVKADNKYPAYNTSQTFDSGYDGGHRLYLRDWLKDGSYRTNYSCNGFGSLNRMSLNVDQSIRIYGRRYLSKEHGFNTGGEISVQPAMSDKDYNIKGGSQSLQNWLGNY